MELSPQSVASTTFKTVKKGYDPDEVRAYLRQLATAIESTQAQATAMEARARAAVARLQELAANPAAAPAASTSGAAAGVSKGASVDEAETISRTLLLAQRTADTTIADAEAEAARIRAEADAEARDAITNARELQNRLVEEAKQEARRAAEGARIQAESEVQALLARRDFLISDVDHLEQHVITHRDRLREVAGALTAIVERGPGGLADLRRPLLSAAAEANEPEPEQPLADATQPMSRLDWMPEDTPDAAQPEREASAETDAAAHDASGNGSADQPPVDVTPPVGAPGLFDDVTAEVPVVSHPANDAFGGRRDERA